MKRKLVTLIMMSVLTMGLVACGSEKDTTNTSAESNKVNVESEAINADNANTDSSSVEATTDSEIQNVEAEETPAITTVKEEEAVVDFDGVKLPMTISWEEFKQFMADNGWTFEDDEDEFPTESKLTAGGFVNTNCGKVHFKFNKNEDGTKSVLMSVTVYKSYSPNTVSIAGINTETTKEALANILEAVDGRDDKFCLDTYLAVTIADESFSINRTYFHMR